VFRALIPFLPRTSGEASDSLDSVDFVVVDVESDSPLNDANRIQPTRRTLMLWTSAPIGNSVTEYTSHGNCYSSVLIYEDGIKALILRHGSGTQRLVYDTLDNALDDAEQHAEQDA
jgi:hypothetical protein